MRRRVAIHEAGHAAVAIRLRIPLVEIKLFSEGDSLDGLRCFPHGHVLPAASPWPSPDSTLAAARKRLTARIIVSYAGYYAEVLYCPELASFEGCEDDFALAGKWFSPLYGSADESMQTILVNDLQERTVKLLREPAVADTLHRIAEVLLDRGEIAYRDARRNYLDFKKRRS